MWAPTRTAAVDYPVFARKVAEAVAAGQAERGIMIDGAGIGSSMVANKVPGVRAAMAYDLSSARNGREHNDANVLTLGAGLIGANLAAQIVDVFLTTDCTEPRHQRRVAMITDVGARRVPRRRPPAAPADCRREPGPGRSFGRGPGPHRRPPDGSAGRQRRCLARRALRGHLPRHRPPFIELGARMLDRRARTSPARIPADMARYIDHTILKPDATVEMVDKIVAEAREHSFRSVCVNPCWVQRRGRRPARQRSADLFGGRLSPGREHPGDQGHGDPQGHPRRRQGNRHGHQRRPPQERRRRLRAARTSWR